MDKLQNIGERIFTGFQYEEPFALRAVIWDTIIIQQCKYRACQYSQQLMDVAELGDALQ